MNNPMYFPQQMGYQPMQQYPAAYPDRLAQLQMNQQQQYAQSPMHNTPQSSGQGLIWVQGEAGAKSFMVTAGATVMLMDSDGDYFYLKSADNAGMPSLRTFAYKEVTGQQMVPNSAPVQDMSKYVTRDEYDKLVEIIRQLAEEKKGVIPDAEQPLI